MLRYISYYFIPLYGMAIPPFVFSFTMNDSVNIHVSVFVWTISLMLLGISSGIAGTFCSSVLNIWETGEVKFDGLSVMRSNMSVYPDTEGKHTAPGFFPLYYRYESVSNAVYHDFFHILQLIKARVDSEGQSSLSVCVQQKTQLGAFLLRIMARKRTLVKMEIQTKTKYVLPLCITQGSVQKML